MTSEPEPDWNEIRRSQFLGDVQSTRKWFEAASELQAAADLLKPRVIEWWDSLLAWQRKERRIFLEHGCHRAFMMLSGFVVENLAKGILVRRLSSVDQAYLHRRARLPNHLLTHNLRSLVRRIGMQSSREEQELLHRMSRMIKWDGRYPIASEFSENGHRSFLDDGTPTSATWLGRNDVERIDQLLDGVREHVGAQKSYRVVRDEPIPPNGA